MKTKTQFLAGVAALVLMTAVAGPAKAETGFFDKIRSMLMPTPVEEVADVDSIEPAAGNTDWSNVPGATVPTTEAVIEEQTSFIPRSGFSNPASFDGEDLNDIQTAAGGDMGVAKGFEDPAGTGLNDIQTAAGEGEGTTNLQDDVPLPEDTMTGEAPAAAAEEAPAHEDSMTGAAPAEGATTTEEVPLIEVAPITPETPAAEATTEEAPASEEAPAEETPADEGAAEEMPAE